MHLFAPSLLQWFVQHARDLPWRHATSAYAVWISEIMLQQTQVSTVLAYYERWLHRFPALADLALASEEDVLKMWEGLGYYRRARFLHRAAKQLHGQGYHDVPADEAILASLPGMGKYTVGAVLSFAFQKAAPAIDANVLRVMGRFLGIQESIDSQRAYRRVHDEVAAFLEHEKPWLMMEGLIELGALVCKKKTSCYSCPLQKGCFAYHHEQQEELPVLKPRKTTITLQRKVFIISCSGLVLIQKAPEGRVLGGLFEFPWANIDDESLEKKGLIFERELSSVTHSFTNHRATLFPAWYRHDGPMSDFEGEWCTQEHAESKYFNAGHKKIYLQLPDEVWSKC